MKDRVLKVGLVGLGRLGKEYAYNLMYKINQVELLGACSLSEEERAYATDVLGVPYVYEDYQDLLELSGLDAVFVVSSTDMHADHMIDALEAGLHVFSEMAITLEQCHRVLKVANTRPDQLAVVGFVRRFDESYRYAKDKIISGAIGRPFLVKSQTVDKDMVSDFQIKYVNRSGGIFHDFNVHDIDLARWFLNSEFRMVHAIGGAFKHPGFAELGDADNVITTCQLENDAMAIIGASRTATHGHDTYTEIVGTEATLRIGRPSAKNRVEIYDVYGARTECVETFWDRFEDAFLNMAMDFVDCILESRRPELTLSDAIKATEVAIAFTQSFKQNEPIYLL